MKYFCALCGRPLEKAYLARGLCEDCYDAEMEEEETEVELGLIPDEDDEEE